MSAIQIFDPALCCSTGVCGVDVDQRLVSVAADVDCVTKDGPQIESVATRHARRYAVLPLLAEEPVGACRLLELVAGEVREAERAE